MPSPVGHTIAGLCGYILARYGVPQTQQLQLLITTVVIANLPDLDMIPGLLLEGNPAAFHRQASHSFFVAAIIGIVIALFVKIPKKKRSSVFCWVTGLYAGHIFLDMLVADTNPPSGVQAFWPLSDENFYAPITVLGGFNYANPNLGIVETLVSFQNLVTVLQEIVVITPLVWLCWYFTRRFYRKRV